jgi:hypothetical protein
VIERKLPNDRGMKGKNCEMIVKSGKEIAEECKKKG